MRTSQLFFPTLRQVAAEAEMASHRLLLRAGFIRQLAAGIYSFLPLGLRVLHKVEQIVREEMDRIGAQEVMLPNLHPEELWARSGRAESFGPELLKLTDRSERVFCLGATHEEVVTQLVATDLRSYRQLPLILYQIQTKFRDEPRPRGGLIRCREFYMKDAYSFDRDEQGLDESYHKVAQAYGRIFERCTLPHVVVEAAGGVIGGTETKEFMLLSEAGEDVLLLCPSCGYGASADQAQYGDSSALAPSAAELLPLEPVETPGMKTVEQVTGFLTVEPKDLVKTLIYSADGKTVAALVRGDRELNEESLRRALGAARTAMGTEELITRVTGAPVGFAGPVGLRAIPLIADEELRASRNFVTGGNRADLHLKHVNWDRDFQVTQWAKLRRAVAGDPCPNCNAALEEKRGIELAHIFKLGTDFSRALDAAFVDEAGERRLAVMGCYGVGVSRIAAALVEHYHDENGIIWPLSVAPYQVIVLILNQEDADQVKLGEELYSRLLESGLEVLLDDRPERAGVKFKDADLIGIPIQVVVGKRAAHGEAEIRLRRDRQPQTLPADQVVARARQLVEGLP